MGTRGGDDYGPQQQQQRVRLLCTFDPAHNRCEQGEQRIAFRSGALRYADRDEPFRLRPGQHISGIAIHNQRAAGVESSLAALLDDIRHGSEGVDPMRAQSHSLLLVRCDETGRRYTGPVRIPSALPYLRPEAAPERADAAHAAHAARPKRRARGADDDDGAADDDDGRADERDDEPPARRPAHVGAVAVDEADSVLNETTSTKFKDDGIRTRLPDGRAAFKLDGEYSTRDFAQTGGDVRRETDVTAPQLPRVMRHLGSAHNRRIGHRYDEIEAHCDDAVVSIDCAVNSSDAAFERKWPCFQLAVLCVCDDRASRFVEASDEPSDVRTTRQLARPHEVHVELTVAAPRQWHVPRRR